MAWNIVSRGWLDTWTGKWRERTRLGTQLAWKCYKVSFFLLIFHYPGIFDLFYAWDKEEWPQITDLI